MWLDTNAAKFPLAKLERDAATLKFYGPASGIAGERSRGRTPCAHVTTCPVCLRWINL